MPPKAKRPKLQSTIYHSLVWDIAERLGVSSSIMYVHPSVKKYQCEVAMVGDKSVVQVDRVNLMTHESILKAIPGCVIDFESYFINTHVFFITNQINPMTSPLLISSTLPVLYGMWDKGYSPEQFDMNMFSMTDANVFFWQWHRVVVRDTKCVSKMIRKIIYPNRVIPSSCTNQERNKFLSDDNVFNFIEAVINCITMIAQLCISTNKRTYPIQECRSCVSANHKVCQLLINIRNHVILDSAYLLPFEEIRTVITEML